MYLYGYITEPSQIHKGTSNQLNEIILYIPFIKCVCVCIAYILYMNTDLFSNKNFLFFSLSFLLTTKPLSVGSWSVEQVCASASENIWQHLYKHPTCAYVCVCVCVFGVCLNLCVCIWPVSPPYIVSVWTKSPRKIHLTLGLAMPNFC